MNTRPFLLSPDISILSATCVRQSAIELIQLNHLSINWLGDSSGEQIINLLFLERLIPNLVNIVELFLFIWLVRCLRLC